MVQFGFFPRNLNLKEARLVLKRYPCRYWTRAIDPDEQVRDAAFKELTDSIYKTRSALCQFAWGRVPKADLRHVQLQGAIC